MNNAAVVSLTGNAISAIAPEQPQPPTVESLTKDLETLEQEQKRVNALAASITAMQYRLTAATSGNLLGNVSLPDLQRAQDDYQEAVDALSRKTILEQAIAQARASLDFTISQERKQFIDDIHRKFDQVHERYVIASKALLELFREMHRLNLQSQSMHSRTLMDQNAYRIDLPAIRREADSELFTVGQMLRDGSY